MGNILVEQVHQVHMYRPLLKSNTATVTFLWRHYNKTLDSRDIAYISTLEFYFISFTERCKHFHYMENFVFYRLNKKIKNPVF
jgi:hypothetical protein